MIGPVGLMSVMSVMMALTMARTGSLSLCDEAVDGLMSRPPNTVAALWCVLCHCFDHHSTQVGRTAPAFSARELAKRKPQKLSFGEKQKELVILSSRTEERALADPRTLYGTVLNAWDALVQDHQAGLVPPKGSVLLYVYSSVGIGHVVRFAVLACACTSTLARQRVSLRACMACEHVSVVAG